MIIPDFINIYTVEPLYKHPLHKHTWLISIEIQVPIFLGEPISIPRYKHILR